MGLEEEFQAFKEEAVDKAEMEVLLGDIDQTEAFKF